MPPSGREYLSLIANRTWSLDVSPMRAQKVTPVRKLLSLGRRPSAPPSWEPHPIDTLSAAQTVKPCPVSCIAYLLPQRPSGIVSAATSPIGVIAAPGELGSPPAHQAPVRPPARAVMKSGVSMSSINAVGSIGCDVSPQFITTALPSVPPSLFRADP